MTQQDRPDGPRATGRTMYRYMVHYGNRELYLDAANQVEACKAAAEAWAPKLERRKADLYAELLREADVIRLRKVERPKIAY